MDRGLGSARSSTVGSGGLNVVVAVGAGGLPTPTASAAPSCANVLSNGHRNGGSHNGDVVPQLRDRLALRASERVGVIVADGEPLYLESLEQNVRRWPEFELLAAAEGPELLDILELASPRVLVVDPTTIGIEREDLFKCASERTRLLLMCTRPRPAEIYSAIAAGASGYLAKDCPKLELCHTIAALARGQERLGASIQPVLAKEIRVREARPSEVLTGREREILMLMCKGMSAPDIGRELHLGLTTVKTHQHHLFEKLGASERAEAVYLAVSRGMIE